MILSVLGFFLWGWFLVSAPCGQSKPLKWFQFSCFLGVALCPIMWSIFENVPCTLEKNVYFASLGRKSLYISVKSISSRVLLSDTISLLIFCLEDLSIFDSGVLKSPTIFVLLSISFLKSSKICLCICVLLCWLHIYLQCWCLLGGLFLEYYDVTFWVSLYGPSLEVYFVWYEYCYPCFFFRVRLLGKFVSSPSLSVCVSLLFWDGSLVGSICVGHVFLSIQLFYVFWLEHLIHLRLMLLSIGSY